MKKEYIILFGMLFYLIFLMGIINALPAFPGAEGMGASTVGGRGGTVYVVSNLNDSGPGSFRWAVTQSGPRIVVFNVSGIINLTSGMVKITNPYITLAGQTSPGGISTTGWTIQFNTHDVIVTHMRFRTGPLGQALATSSTHPSLSDYERGPDAVHSIQVFGTSAGTGTDPAYNIIFDHCSFSWGIDENIDLDYDYYDITFSWCSIIDPLMDSHSKGATHNLGLLAWGKETNHSMGITTIHHCFFGYMNNRVPEMNNYGFLDETNDVIYWAYSSFAPLIIPATSNSIHVNFKNCYNDVRGSASELDPSTRMQSYSAILDPSSTAYPAIYMTGCLSAKRTSQGASEWDVGDFSQQWGRVLLSTAWQSTSEFPVHDIPVTATAMNSTYARTVALGAGASKPSFDSVDLAAQGNYTAGTGAFKYASSLNGPEDWPVFSNPLPPIDSDKDGMADSFEISNFGSIIATSSGDADADGYTNIEEYLHYLGGYENSSIEPPTQNKTSVQSLIYNFKQFKTGQNILSEYIKKIREWIL
jgi:hypothetical protein